MKNFLKITEVNVGKLMLELHRQPNLWDKNVARLSKFGPHHETHDIWLRYKDETENAKTGNYANFGDPHDGIWYPAFYSLPAARPIIFNLMAMVEGERLGGILLYSVPPGKKIHPHIDTGWHVDYYEKFNVCLQSNPLARFCYQDEVMIAKAGDIHRFRNDVEHWVENEGPEDHIVLTVCIRTHDYSTRFQEESNVRAA